MKNGIKILPLNAWRRKVRYLSIKGRGAYSLKEVLPALVPELTYEGMEISDGQMASNAFLHMWELEDETEVRKKNIDISSQVT